MNTKKNMQSKDDMMNKTVWLFLLAVVLVSAYVIFATKLQLPAETALQGTTIQESSDLDQAADELRVVDVDSVEVGVGDLSKEVAAY